MSREYRVNNQISADKVCLVMPDGSIMKEVPFSKALSIADEENLDLVEMSISKDDDLPVCKLLDYGKMIYHQSKKEKSNKSVQHVKEIKYGFNISSHDLEVKHKKVKEFLSKKYTVRYVLELRGREKNLSSEAMEKVKNNLKYFDDIASWKEPTVASGSSKLEISTTLHSKK